MNTTPHRFAAAAVALSLGTAAAISQCTLPAPGTLVTPTPVDAWTTVIPLGFPFVFKGSVYHQIYVSDHALIALDNGSAGSPPAGGAFLWNPNVNNLIGPRPLIAPYWSDHTAGTIGEVYVDNTSGTECTVTWADHATYLNQQPTFSVQVTLFATGLITMRRDCRVQNQGSIFGALNAIVGIGTPGTSLPSPTDLSSATNAWSDTVYEEFVTTSSGTPNPLFDLAHSTHTFFDQGPGAGYTIVQGLYPPEPTTIIVDPSPDVTYYGSASGQEANARMNVFGLPAGGQALQLALDSARPNAFAVFLIGFTPTNMTVPGIGMLLTDPSSALTFVQLTDAYGDASLPIAIPNLPSYGQELYAQVATLDMAATFGLSDAAGIEIGAEADPVAMVSFLDGTVNVAGGPIVPASGIDAMDAEVGTLPGQIRGSVAPYVQAANFVVNGILVEDLTIEVDTANAALVWGPVFTVPSNTPMGFVVSYSSGGQEYGPFTIASNATAPAGQFQTQAITLPMHPGPLSMRSLSLQLTERRLDDDYFTQLANLILPPEGVPTHLAATPGDVMQQLAAAQALMQAAIAAHIGDTSFFDAAMPNYSQFLAYEAINLQAASCGLASTAADVHLLIANGVIGAQEGWGKLIVAKLLAALGVVDGAKAIQQILLKDYAKLLKEFRKYIQQGEYKKAARVLAKILKKMMTKSFLKKLEKKLGKKAAAKIIAALGGKFVPGVGWVWFFGSLVWAIVEQW